MAALSAGFYELINAQLPFLALSTTQLSTMRLIGKIKILTSLIGLS